MKTLFAFLLSVSALAQVNSQNVTIIPSTNSTTGVPNATGALRYQDLGVGASRKEITFSAPAAFTATQHYVQTVDYPSVSGMALTSTTGGTQSWAAFANAQLSNLGTTAINADLLPGLDDTRKIGDAFRFYEVNANRFNGICSGCSTSVNYINTRKVNIFDGFAGASAFWNIATNISLGVNSILFFTDNVGNTPVQIQTYALGAYNPITKFESKVYPNTDATYPIGGPSDRFTNITLSDLAGVGTRQICATSVGLITLTGCPAGTSLPVSDATIITQDNGDSTKQFRLENSGITTATTRVGTIPNANFTFAGIDIAQTFSATQTMRDIEAVTDDTYKLGLSNRFYELNANRINGICSGCSTSVNYVNTRKVNIYDGLAGGGAFWNIATNVSAGVNSVLFFTDNVGNVPLQIQTYALSAYNPISKFATKIYPTTDATYPIGGPSDRFTNITLSDLAGVGTRGICATSVGLITVSGCTAGTGTVTSAVIAGTASQITASGTCTITTTGTCTLSVPANPSFSGQLTMTTGVQLGASGNLLQGVSTRIDGSGNGSFATVSATTDVLAGSNIKTGAFAGTTRIDSSGNGTFGTVSGSTGTFSGLLSTSAGNIQVGASNVFAVSGGFFGQDIINAGSGVVLNKSGGGTCTLFFKAGILYAQSGC